MKNRLGVVCLGLSLGLSLSFFSNGVFAKDKVSVFFENLKTLTADFEQVVENAQLGSSAKASGKLWIQRPGKFRWDYTAPYAQEIVSDGQKIWIFDADLEQVIVKPVNASMGNTPAVLLSDTQPVAETFIIEDIGAAADLTGNGNLHWVKLTPKDPEASFTAIRLGFNAATLSDMLMEDNLGQTTRLQFSHVKRNSKISPEKFVFTAPKGVDVFDTSE